MEIFTKKKLDPDFGRWSEKLKKICPTELFFKEGLYMVFFVELSDSYKLKKKKLGQPLSCKKNVFKCVTSQKLRNSSWLFFLIFLKNKIKRKI